MTGRGSGLSSASFSKALFAPSDSVPDSLMQKIQYCLNKVEYNGDSNALERISGEQIGDKSEHNNRNDPPGDCFQ